MAEKASAAGHGDEHRRDLRADLKLCEGAPPGPWERRDVPTNGDEQRYVAPPGWKGMPVLYSYCQPHTALDFACAAREGWPVAIRRALAAEAECERLREEIVRLREELAGAYDAMEAARRG